MRDMTENEIKDFFELKRCPACRQTDKGWYEGGSGGISQNLKCANCGLGLNISYAFTDWGQIIYGPDKDFPKDQLFDPDIREPEREGGFATKPTRSIGDSKFLDWFEDTLSKIGRAFK